MRFGVVVFPGTWSDCDFHYVISEVIRQPVKYVWHRDRNLADLDCVVLPGGFSYGDYLRAGAVAGKSPVVEALREFVANGEEHARARVDEMCRKLLANPILEDYTIEVVGDLAAPRSGR